MPRSANRVTWHDDTLREMATWAAKRYRIGHIQIVWRSKIEKPKGGGISSGCTICMDDKPPFFIELLEGRTHFDLIQVLAHELGHCIAIHRYRNHRHDKQFVRIANELIAAWNRRNEKRK